MFSYFLWFLKRFDKEVWKWKLKWIFILIQLSEMHWTGRVNLFVSISSSNCSAERKVEYWFIFFLCHIVITEKKYKDLDFLTLLNLSEQVWKKLGPDYYGCAWIIDNCNNCICLATLADVVFKLLFLFFAMV